MAIKELAPAEVCLPEFDPGTATEADVFDLTSHKRAREALEFGFGIRDPRFNIFVLGGEQSGRLSSTLSFIRADSASRPPPSDWIYLNNFRRPTEPRPYQLPAGVGYTFQQRMDEVVKGLTDAMREAFGAEELQQLVRAEETKARTGVTREIEALRETARGHGLDLLQTPQGIAVVAVGDDGTPVQGEMTAEQKAAAEQHGPGLSSALAAIIQRSAQDKAALRHRLDEIGQATADQASTPILDQLVAEFGDYSGLAGWFVELRGDVVEHYKSFLYGSHHGGSGGQQDDDAEDLPHELLPERRYAVNLLVDNRGAVSAPVIVEPNPNYRNLFGFVQYRQEERGFETDFTMIQAGALHRANGGVLVLRADEIAESSEIWEYLKAALRDGEVRIAEPHRENNLPVAGAPQPAPVPLSIKVVMIAAPKWYYTFYSVDPEFASLFKIKADIDADMRATPDNVRHYSALIRTMATNCGATGIDDEAVKLLLGLASRWAGHRGRLSSQFERVEDVVVEAYRLARIDYEAGGGRGAGGGGNGTRITRALAIRALQNRRRRNSRVMDRLQTAIAEGTVMVDVVGSEVGQVNALTVRDVGDMMFGLPARVTARASVGRHGVVNIERNVELGGPIQQKGVMVLQGFLAGVFARRFPLSFNCSVTFEQSYGGVEGDSASMAELLAVLSDLSGLALRQDLAVTGSVNQLGEAQVIGGALEKIEGFHRSCLEKGGLTGTQGVVIPAANVCHVVLRPDIGDDVSAGKFHVYGVETVDDAVELLTGVPAGIASGDGSFPNETVYGRVMAQLETFDQALRDRYWAP